MNIRAKTSTKQKVRDYIRENPGHSLEDMNQNIRAPQKAIKSAVHNLKYEKEIIRDEEDKFFTNPDFDKNNKSTRAKSEITEAQKVEVIPSGTEISLSVDHDSIPNHVSSAFQSLEKLTIDRQVCLKALTDIKQAVDQALNHLLKS